MTTLKKVSSFLDNYFPLAWQEDYDNSGLIISNGNREISKVLVSVDITEAVVDEAIEEGCELIVSHHPLIFGNLKRLKGQTFVERAIQSVIKNDIAVYALHTNLDNHHLGLNRMLAGMLGLHKLQILRPKTGTLRKLVTFCPTEHANEVRKAIFEAGAGHIGDYDSCSYNTAGQGSFRALDNANPFVGNKNELHFENELKIEAIYPVHLEPFIIRKMIEAHPYEEVAYDILLLGNENKETGSGIVGYLPEKVIAKDFLEKVKSVCRLTFVKYTGNPEGKIQKVALCGGSGSFLIKDAMKAGADIFMTGDLKYHDYFIPEDTMLLADIGHYESEQFSKDLIVSLLKKNFANFAVLKTKHNTNPVKYL